MDDFFNEGGVRGRFRGFDENGNRLKKHEQLERASEAPMLVKNRGVREWGPGGARTEKREDESWFEFSFRRLKSLVEIKLINGKLDGDQERIKQESQEKIESLLDEGGRNETRRMKATQLTGYESVTGQTSGINGIIDRVVDDDMQIVMNQSGVREDPLGVFIKRSMELEVKAQDASGDLKGLRAAFYEGVRINVRLACLEEEQAWREDSGLSVSAKLKNDIRELQTRKDFLVWGGNKDDTKLRWENLAARHADYVVTRLKEEKVAAGAGANKEKTSYGGQVFREEWSEIGDRSRGMEGLKLKKRVETLTEEVRRGICRDCGAEVGGGDVCVSCGAVAPKVYLEEARSEFDRFVASDSLASAGRGIRGESGNFGTIRDFDNPGNMKDLEEKRLEEARNEKPGVKKDRWMWDEDLQGFGIPLVAPVQEFGGGSMVVTEKVNTVDLWNKKLASYDQLDSREEGALNHALSKVKGIVALNQLISKHWDLAATSNLDTIKALFGGAKDFYFQEAFKLVARHAVGKKIFGPMMAIAFCEDSTSVGERKKKSDQEEAVWSNLSKNQLNEWKKVKVEELRELYNKILSGKDVGAATTFGLRVRELFPQVFYETSDTKDTLIVTAGTIMNEVLAEVFGTSRGMVDITSALVKSINFQWQCFRGAQMYANFPGGEKKIWSKGIAGNLPAGTVFVDQENSVQAEQDMKEYKQKILKNWKNLVTGNGLEEEEKNKPIQEAVKAILEATKGKKSTEVQLWEYIDVFMNEMDRHGIDERGMVNEIFLGGLEKVDKTAMARGWSQYSELLGVFNDIRLAIQGKKTEASKINDLIVRVKWVRENIIQKINSWAGFNAEMCYRVADDAADAIGENWKKNPASGGEGLPPHIATLEKVRITNEEGKIDLRKVIKKTREASEARFRKKYSKKLDF